MNKKVISLILFLICFNLNIQAKAIIQDDFVNTTLKNKNLEKPYVHNNYNYEDTKRVPVRLSVIADINSEKDLTEGQTVVFRSLQDVWHKGKKIIAKDELVNARVETIISSGMNGIPASIIFSDFKFKNVDEGQFSDTYEKYGQDRSLWVYPLKWALTILPPTGSLTNFIKGGHAKLKSDEVVEIYYYPNW